MRMQSLFLLVMCVYGAIIAGQEPVTDRTVLETTSARVKIPPDSKKEGENRRKLSEPTLHAFVEGKVYPVPEADRAQAEVGKKTPARVVLSEYIVPKEVSPSVVADHLANSLTLAVIFADSLSFGLAGEKLPQYQITPLPTGASGTAQYQVVRVVSSSPHQEQVVGWVALYWRSERVVGLYLLLPRSKEVDARQWEKEWSKIFSSFEWKNGETERLGIIPTCWERAGV